MSFNEKYSFKDFMGHSFKDKKPKEFNDTELIGSCFYQECVYDDPMVLKDIFPDGMKGVTFRRCNLDNVYIPAGNTVEPDCTHKKIKIQNDLEDWILDTTLKPVEPMSKNDFIRLGISIAPKDIPQTKMEKSITQQKEDELSASELV